MSALQVSGRAKTYSRGGNGGLVKRVQDLREELRRAHAEKRTSGEDQEVVVVEHISYECGFRKCWCRLEAGGSAWVILRGGAASCEKGSRLCIAQPFHRLRVEDQEVLLVSHFESES